MSDSIVINVNLTTNPITVAFGAPASVISVNFQTARDAYQLSVADGFVGSRAEWNAAHFGQDGDDGREIEVRNSGTFVQWRYVGDALWTDLIALGDITGADGEDGADSTVPGPPGDPIELQAAGGFIQWKFVSEDGTAWRNLVALSVITGPSGSDATVTTETVGTAIAAATAKTTPVDSDGIGIIDSAASNVLKLLTFANLWVWIRGLVDVRHSTIVADFDYNSTTAIGATGGGGTWTWTPPTTAKILRITLVSGGAGGGSGRCGASGTDRWGGGGGASGATTIVDLATSFLTGGALKIVIGSGGSGGSAINAPNTNGNNGSLGGETYIEDNGKKVAVAQYGSSIANGRGGTTTSGVAGITGGGGYVGTIPSVSGTSGSNLSAALKSGGMVAEGGAGGGGVNTSNAIGRGGVGSAVSAAMLWGGIPVLGNYLPTHPFPGVDGDQGTTQTSILTRVPGGPGGVGGNGGLTVKGGDGTHGTRGGGGGGGGGGTNGIGSGAGGNGGDGFVRIEVIS